jgi:hypothetical protein
MLTKEDKKILSEKGIDEKSIEYQLSLFQKGTPYMKLERPAIVNDGILKFAEYEIDNFIKIYDNYLRESDRKIVKFVPASGAATRMFKEFFACLNSNCADLNNFPLVRKYCDNYEKFAFYGKLNDLLRQKTGRIQDELIKEGDCQTVISALATSFGLNYGHTPKGLIEFHRYKNGSTRTAFEEHLFEGVRHIVSNNNAYFHFTISPEFNEDFNLLAGKYKSLNGSTLEIEFSNQYHSTDTIAVNEKNELVRTPDGSLLFRPGGHGSLLKNLASIDASMIFVKNIDNISHGDYIDISVKYKKFLGGVAFELKKKIDNLRDRLSKDGNAVLSEIKSFLKKFYFLDFFPEFNDVKEELDFYRYFLDRPFRVAGMVKNEGEPGGGPFWIKYKDMNFSTLQIVEKSQINTSDPQQNQILLESTHFNPVDMVVIFDKNKHDLNDYVDRNAYFISHKSYEGQNIKALEWPGLWNGSMSDWLTVFVEIPLETFNPVKVVTDLLKKYHQPAN